MAHFTPRCMYLELKIFGVHNALFSVFGFETNGLISGPTLGVQVTWNVA